MKEKKQAKESEEIQAEPEPELPPEDMINQSADRILLQRFLRTLTSFRYGSYSSQCLRRNYKQPGHLIFLKHFPGLGSAEEDTHDGKVEISKTTDEMRASDFVPFQKGIN